MGFGRSCVDTDCLFRARRCRTGPRQHRRDAAIAPRRTDHAAVSRGPTGTHQARHGNPGRGHGFFASAAPPDDSGHRTATADPDWFHDGSTDGGTDANSDANSDAVIDLNADADSRSDADAYA